MSDIEWAFGAAILLFAGIVKGVIGFGLPILAVPLLSLFLGPREAVVTVSFSLFLTNITIVRIGISEWRTLKNVALFGLTGILMVPVGVLYLQSGDPDLIRLLIGLTVWAYFAGKRLIPPIDSVRPITRGCMGIVAGAAAGFMGGVAGIPGPVSIMYFSMFRWSKEVFIFLLNSFNTLSSAGLVSMLAIRGEYTRFGTGRAVLALIPVLIGFWIGLRMRHRLNQELFYRLVRTGLFVISLGLVGRALWKYLL
ncbi:MAG: sulfite exporter TauE/SafE family protein [bacterium]|nr:sulfite exporter TauE/SafE family protein [bacterium]